MESPASTLSPVDRPKSNRAHVLNIIRMIVVIVLAAAVVTSMALLFGTSSGREVLDRDALRQLGHDFQQWVRSHPVSSPVIYVGVFVTLSILILPMWWLQILSGYGFGLVFGTALSVCGATIGAVLSLAISRWIAGDFFHEKVEGKLDLLRRLDERLGHNGFLVVMTVRLSHFTPFGLSNYAFGLTRITAVDVLVGTGMGSIPAIAVYVAMGAGYHPWNNWRFLACLAAINIALFVPVILRYLRPQWFRRIGVE